jgi:hypothetical protein
MNSTAWHIQTADPCRGITAWLALCLSHNQWLTTGLEPLWFIASRFHAAAHDICHPWIAGAECLLLGYFTITDCMESLEQDPPMGRP